MTSPAMISGNDAHVEQDSKRGWLVVLGAIVGVSVGLSPVPFYTVGMFAPVLSDEFGWSFAAMMATLTIQSAVTIVTAPLAGMLIDRLGARPVAMVSLVLFGFAYASLSLNPGSIWIFYGQWIVMSIAGAGTLSGTWTCVVNGWFTRNRGLALGFASTGTGLTGIAIKPLTAWLLLTYDWRVAFVVIGALPIIVGLPIVAMLFREPPKASASKVEAIASEDTEPAAPPDNVEGLTLREAIARKNFWVMCAAFLLIAFALTAPTPNLENILRSLDFDLAAVGRISAAFGLAVIVGRVGGGWLLDRIWAPITAVAIFALPAIGGWLLAHQGISELTAFCAVASLGLAAGFEFDLLAYLVSRYFGQRSYGTIYGCFFAMVVIGGGLGPVLYGYVFDRTGTYDVMLRIGAGIVVAGAALLLLMGPYPRSWATSKK